MNSFWGQPWPQGMLIIWVDGILDKFWFQIIISVTMSQWGAFICIIKKGGMSSDKCQIDFSGK